MSKSLRHKAKRTKSVKKTKDAFTRFSVTYFSSVIEALSPERRKIIESYGFDPLLKFQKFFVPNKFAKWVAQHIDYKSGDFILKEKILPITSDTVHLVLDIPIGGDAFPRDSAAGKSYLLSRFQQVPIPSVKFFGDKLIENLEMSEEDVFTCFLLVALNCFLCPTSSLFPSPKYIGIFEDLSNFRNLDWCKFVFDWLFDAIRSFNKTNKAGKEKQTLGGCLYLIVVFTIWIVLNLVLAKFPLVFPAYCFEKIR